MEACIFLLLLWQFENLLLLWQFVTFLFCDNFVTICYFCDNLSLLWQFDTFVTICYFCDNYNLSHKNFRSFIWNKLKFYNDEFITMTFCLEVEDIILSFFLLFLDVVYSLLKIKNYLDAQFLQHFSCFHFRNNVFMSGDFDILFKFFFHFFIVVAR